MIPARPERIYAAWLSSDEHTAFTGDKAVVEPFVGGAHSAFDGYAVGRTVDLQPGHRIVQTWRAEDFPVGSPDSRVEVTLEETVGGTMLTILHTEIPSGQGSHYRDGWLKYYLEPLKGFFAGEARRSANGVRTRAPSAAARSKASSTKARKAKARRPKTVRAPAKRAATTKSKMKKASPAKNKKVVRGKAKPRAAPRKTPRKK
jgi:uncharacterized protein YndB with AHSA1/START domain